ncbi:hypothetical protein R1flu_016896 [Riccia fluitans]|uniref:Uncharacterized protein n=1 Tax=Riccia fluitans TaxID=41844 RepID=A0ABD1YN92_9MARC
MQDNIINARGKSNVAGATWWNANRDGQQKQNLSMEATSNDPLLGRTSGNDADVDAKREANYHDKLSRRWYDGELHKQTKHSQTAISTKGKMTK